MKRVKFGVEPSSAAGAKDDLETEQLVLEITTDGTVAPDMAVVEGAKILRKHLMPFGQFEREGPAPPPPPMPVNRLANLNPANAILESPLAVLRQILDEEPPRLLTVSPNLDPRIAQVVEHMVAKEPNDRYQTCHEVVSDLNAVLGGGATATHAAAAAASRAAVLPPLPGAAPVSATARTQAQVSARAEDAPTRVAPSRPGVEPRRSPASRA